MKNLILLFIAIVWMNACVVTRAEGDQIQADLDRLTTEIAQLQRSQSDIEIRLQSRLSESKKQLMTMQEAFEHIQHLGAEADVHNEQLIQDMRSLTGRMEELEHRLGVNGVEQAGKVKTNESNIVPLPTPVAVVPESASAEELFALGKSAYDDGEYEKSIGLLDAFLEKGKADKKNRDNANYWKGEALFRLAERADTRQEKQAFYKKAVLVFQNVLTQYPNSSKVEASLYKIGLSMDALGFPNDAKVFFEEIVDKHPKSTLVQPAKKHLQSIQQRTAKPKPASKPQ